MSPELFRQTRDAQQLNGLSDKTQEAYLRAVRLLIDFHACSPEQLTETQLRASLASAQCRPLVAEHCGSE